MHKTHVEYIWTPKWGRNSPLKRTAHA